MDEEVGYGAMTTTTATMGAHATKSTYGDRVGDRSIASAMATTTLSAESSSFMKANAIGERAAASENDDMDVHDGDQKMTRQASTMGASSLSSSTMDAAATIDGGEINAAAARLTSMMDDSDSTVTDKAGMQEVQDADATFEETAEEQAEDEDEEVSFADIVAVRLNELKAESSEKQKSWLEKVRKVHEVEGAASFTEDEDACGRAGPLAVYTIWNHVPDEVREAIVDFMTASEAESKSPHSLLALRTKTTRVVKTYDIKFGGQGEELRQCIGNYYVRRRVHEVLESLEAAKEARGEAIKPVNEEEIKAEQIRIGRVAQRLKKTIMSQIAPAANFANDDNVGGTSIVLALNCRAKHPTRLLAAVVHALRARFALGDSDFTLVVGRNSVEDELMTLFQKPASQFIESRGVDFNSGAARIASREEVCPDLPGIEGPPERKPSVMEKAMRDAENHVLLEHQGSNDPTNPVHLHSGPGFGTSGTLPGMPQMFNGKSMESGRDSSLARKEAHAQFGLSESRFGTHNTDHLRSRADRRKRAFNEDVAKRGPVGFNAMPQLQDPLSGYLQEPARPNAYNI